MLRTACVRVCACVCSIERVCVLACSICTLACSIVAVHPEPFRSVTLFDHDIVCPWRCMPMKPVHSMPMNCVTVAITLRDNALYDDYNCIVC
jgi:hypothetical protein